MTSSILATVGLIIDIVGVVLVMKYDPGRPLAVRDSKGEEVLLPLGSSAERKVGARLFSWGAYLIVLGFLVQILSQWVR
ncbi:MAG: hypothetical protein Q7U82_12945 [Gammaproteobacteria bacterium]|nr:hypothetical protein [Gammaproteobacteria bacterium]MDO9318608.1 hypothetical protein [Gammaproteobacteria bacterium]